MNESSLYEMVIDEIRLLPEPQVAELYDLVHYLRIGIQSPKAETDRILAMSNGWRDMPEPLFQDFLGDIRSRRHTAFAERRSNETCSR